MFSLSIERDFVRSTSEADVTTQMWIVVVGLPEQAAKDAIHAACDSLALRKLRSNEHIEFVFCLPYSFEDELHGDLRDYIWGSFLELVRNRHPDKDRISFAASTLYY